MLYQKIYQWKIEIKSVRFVSNKSLWKAWAQKLNSSLKNGYFGALIFKEIEYFEHLKYNFKTSWPPKFLIFKKYFTVKITLISMIKSMPLTFLDVKK